MDIQFIQTCVDDFISEQLAQGALAPNTGIAVSIVQESQPLLQRTYGLRDREQALPVTARTIFEMGSLAKPLTSLALLMAQEEGLLDLEQPINGSKNRISLKEPEASKQLSVIDILSHRTGLPSHDCLWYFGPDSIQELVARISNLDPVQDGYGKTFIYSNLMYGALRLVFEEMLGETWESYLRRKIFEPLKMEGASFHTSANGLGADFAQPYSALEKIERKEVTAVAPAAGVRMSIEDVTQWMRLLLGGGVSPAGTRLIHENSLQKMRNSQIEVGVINPVILQGLEWCSENLSYGIGWFVGKAQGKKVYFQPSIINGFTAVMMLVPEMKLGLTVLTNTNLTPFPGLLAQHLFKLFQGEKPSHKSSDVLSAESVPASPVSSSEQPKSISVSYSIVGKYYDPGYGELEIVKKGSSAFVKYGRHEWPMSFHSSNEASFLLPAFGVQLPMTAQFEVKNGQAEKVMIPFSLDPRVGPQIFKRI